MSRSQLGKQAKPARQKLRWWRGKRVRKRREDEEEEEPKSQDCRARRKRFIIHETKCQNRMSYVLRFGTYLKLGLERRKRVSLSVSIVGLPPSGFVVFLSIPPIDFALGGGRRVSLTWQP